MNHVESIILNAPWVWIEADDEIPAHEYIKKEWVDEDEFNNFSLKIRREGEAEFYCGGAVYFKIGDCYYWNKSDDIIARVYDEDLKDKNKNPHIETPAKLIESISPYKHCAGCGKKFDRAFLNKDGFCKKCQEGDSGNMEKHEKKYPRGLRRPRCKKCDELYDKYEPNPFKLCPACNSGMKDKPEECTPPAKAESAVAALPCPTPAPYKECLVCDGKMFYLLKGGILKCAGCGLEFKLNR